jgi:hypothetical protein
MIQMDNFESTINILIEELARRCPRFRPAIFPSYLSDSRANITKTLREHIGKETHTQISLSKGSDIALITEISVPSHCIRVVNAMVSY